MIPKMLMLTRAVSNLLWFMDLTFQVPMQYCSLQHQMLLPSPVRSTTGCWFFFSSVSSFFLELFFHWPQKHIGTYRPMEFIFQCPIFLSFHTFVGVLKARILGLPFPSPVDHILSELSTINHLSWMALLGMAPCFIELDKAVVHVIRFVTFLWLWFSFCLPSDGEG